MTTPTPEVVEAVAKAIHMAGRSGMSWLALSKDVREMRYNQARAAIAEYLKQTGGGK